MFNCRRGSILVKLLFLLVLLGIAAFVAWRLTGFNFMHRLMRKSTSDAQDTPNKPAANPPAKLAKLPSLGELDRFAKFLPNSPTLIGLINLDQMRQQYAFSLLSGQFQPLLRGLRLKVGDIGSVMACQDDAQIFVAIRGNRDLVLNDLFDQPMDPVAAGDGAKLFRAKMPHGAVLAALPEPRILVLMPDGNSGRAGIQRIQAAAKNAEPMINEHLVEPLRTVYSRDAFAVYIPPRAGQADSSHIAFGGASLGLSSIDGKGYLAYADEKAAKARYGQIAAMRTELIQQQDPVAAILQTITLEQRGDRVIATGRVGVTDVVRLIMNNPGQIGASLMKIGNRLGLLNQAQ